MATNPFLNPASPGSSQLRDLTPLGRALISASLIEEDDLREALAEQSRTRQPLIRILLDSKAVNELDLAKLLATRFGLEFVELADVNVDSTASSLIPASVAKKHQVLPVGWRDERLVLAMADPTDVLALDDVRAMTRKDVVVVVTVRSLLLSAIERAQRVDEDSLDLTTREASEQAVESAFSSTVAEIVDDAPIIRLVNMTISQAVADRASDIHIEPLEGELRIRFRIDGVLHEFTRVPKNLHSGIITRLKLMANLNIAERRVPQDGRMSGTIEGKLIDMRVATLPTVEGEKVVMRILDKSTAQFRLEELGFLDESMKHYESAYRRPWGTILVTGPTGSGKSTTLYATVNILNSVSRNIITVEDPVEYRLDGISQIQVNVKAGLGFATALRSILRSDPDVILVGEIRDRETAVIAIEASLTGHLVLSSLHTNDSSSTPSRLMEMGVEPYLIASSLDCVVAQRLARRLCEHCKEEIVIKEADLSLAGWNFDRFGVPESLYKAQGCGRCSKTGYTGRIALHEVLLVGEEIERVIAEGGQSDLIRKVAIESGMMEMRDVGQYHVKAGVTSLEEILRIIA